MSTREELIERDIKQYRIRRNNCFRRESFFDNDAIPWDDLTPQQQRILYNTSVKRVLSNPNKRSDMERLRKIANKLGSPDDDYKIVHVAGTNGKGSVCYKVASILTAANYQTGLFTSPHISSIRERYRIDGKPISMRDFITFESCLYQFLKENCLTCSWFEKIFLIGLLIFSYYECDVVVLEAGIGGKKDSTNIVSKPDVCVITSIGYDHQVMLGTQLDEIAFQKSGIIKSCPVVLGPTAQAYSSIEAQIQRATAVHCVNEIVGESINDENMRIALAVCSYFPQITRDVKLFGCKTLVPCRKYVFSPRECQRAAISVHAYRQILIGCIRACYTYLLDSNWMFESYFGRKVEDISKFLDSPHPSVMTSLIYGSMVDVIGYERFLNKFMEMALKDKRDTYFIMRTLLTSTVDLVDDLKIGSNMLTILDELSGNTKCELFRNEHLALASSIGCEPSPLETHAANAIYTTNQIIHTVKYALCSDENVLYPQPSTIIIDAGHNITAINRVVREIHSEMPNKKIKILFCASNGRNAELLADLPYLFDDDPGLFNEDSTISSVWYLPHAISRMTSLREYIDRLKGCIVEEQEKEMSESSTPRRSSTNIVSGALAQYLLVHTYKMVSYLTRIYGGWKFTSDDAKMAFQFNLSMTVPRSISEVECQLYIVRSIVRKYNIDEKALSLYYPGDRDVDAVSEYGTNEKYIKQMPFLYKSLVKLLSVCDDISMSMDDTEPTNISEEQRNSERTTWVRICEAICQYGKRNLSDEDHKKIVDLNQQRLANGLLPTPIPIVSEVYKPVSDEDIDEISSGDYTQLALMLAFEEASRNDEVLLCIGSFYSLSDVNTFFNQPTGDIDQVHDETDVYDQYIKTLADPKGMAKYFHNHCREYHTAQQTEGIKKFENVIDWQKQFEAVWTLI